MKTYEGIFIFDETVKEERVKELAGVMTGEIQKHAGTILQNRELGRRSFARTMQKKESGWYQAVIFQMPEDKLAPLNARLKLTDELFRFQIVRLDERFVNKEAGAPQEKAAVGA